jgi:predicted kinase
MPTLVIVGGVPGTGKSTIADAIAGALGIPIFNKDKLEASLWRSGITTEKDSWQVAEDLLGTLAHEQLRSSQSAILDTVAGRGTSRDGWRSIAHECGGAFKPIECICSDEELHRSRIEGRVRGIPGWYELTWDDVERSRSRFEPWDGDRLVLDTARPLDDNVAAALGYVNT